MAGGDLEQAGGLLPLLPQRGALAGSALRQEQRTRRGLAEAGAEERRARERVDDELGHHLGVGDEVLHREVVDRVGEAQHDAVVAPQHLDVDAEPVAQAAAQCHAPRRVHPRAERSEDADAPVAQLVREPLDDDGAVVGDRAGGLHLLVEVGDEVAGRELVERGLGPEVGDGIVGVRVRRSRVNAPMARPSSIGRPGWSPCQNGIFPCSPGAGRTITRSWVIWSIRQVLAPSTNVSPGRLS